MALFSPEVIIDNTTAIPVDASGSTVPVSGPLTDTQLRASAVPVSVSGSVAVSNFPATQPVSGTIAVSNFPATQPVSGTVSISGTVATTTGNASTSTITLTSVGTTSVNVLAANANRKKIVIFAAKSTLYVKLGATASAASFTYALTVASSTLEISGWGGQVDVLSTVNANTITVTELV